MGTPPPREKLALLCQEHEVAREACRRALATPQGASLGEGLIPALTNEQRTMLRNILEVVDRLEAEDKTQHSARKQRLDASIERAFRKDIDAFYLAARWIERLAPFSRRLRPVEVITHFEGVVMGELDLRLESSSAAE